MDDSLRDSLPEHLPLIRGIVRRMAPGAGLTDELTQECCVRLIEKEALWRNRAHPRPWIRAVTRNLALRRLGQFRNRQRLEAPLPAEPEAKAGPEPVEDQIAWLLSQFALLPPKQQEVLKMRYFEGLETTEIAEKMGVSESTVATHHARALETMKRKARYAGWLPALLAWLALNKGKAALAAGIAAVTVSGAYFFTTDPSTHLAVDSTALQQTVVVAHPDTAMPAGKNVLYCAAFQLAWDELKKLHSKNLRFRDPLPIADALNRGWLPKESLSPGSAVAMAGTWSEDFKRRLNDALEKAFRQGPDPYLEGVSASPGDLVAYAFLAKDLAFKTPFYNLKNHPIAFGKDGVPVRAFGADGDQELTLAQAEQLKLYTEKPLASPFLEAPYVLAIHPKESQEELLLANIEPAATLEETIAVALKLRDLGHEAEVEEKSRISIPMMDLDIRHRFPELVGRKIEGGQPILEALQTLRFKLDEKGARLRARALLIEQKIHLNLSFDQPYLLLMRQKGVARPYLALWVENPEILIPVK